MVSGRKIFLVSGLAVGLLAVGLFLLSILVSNYSGRMRDDEAVNTYERLWPTMPGGTVPLGGGIETWRKSDPQRMPNPWPPTEAVIDRGKRSYRFYCSHCHGPRYDGQATVGQSFYPLPTDLLDPRVQRQSDGELFYKISLGHKRHPPLQATVAAEDGWAVILFLRAQTRTPRAASDRPLAGPAMRVDP